MTKKATIRDVARESGVSVATVSYVLNNRTDQKISAETRKKVLQIANLLQFTPSYAAKQLTTGKSNIIGIQAGNALTHTAETNAYIGRLISCLARHGYKTMVLPPLKEIDAEPYANIDGIICIDLSSDDFTQLSDKYLIPIVCADMIVHHYLFFQIYDAYDRLKEALAAFPAYTVLMHPPQNEAYRDFLSETFGDSLAFCADPSSLKTILSQRQQPFVTIGDYLTLCAKALAPDSRILPVCSKAVPALPFPAYYHTDPEEKCEKTVHALFDAMSRNPVDHDIKISV